MQVKKEVNGDNPQKAHLQPLEDKSKKFSMGFQRYATLTKN